MKKVKLTLFERRIEKGNNFVPISEEEHNKIRACLAAARKNRYEGIVSDGGTTNVKIRFVPSDIDKIREMSDAKGLWYKTFIANIIHDYVTGKLVDKDSIQ